MHAFDLDQCLTIICTFVVVCKHYVLIAFINLEVLKQSFRSCCNDNCDMIKGNESDVVNVDFELLAKRGDRF